MYDDQWIDNLIAWDERRKLGEPLPEDSISSIELDKFRTGISRLQATEWMTLDAAETVEKTWSSLHSPGSLLIDPMLGSKIGAFEIVKLMGSGGMGTVYAASRLSDYRQLVAIKVLRLDIDRRDWRERFERERQLLAELNHPHICRMLDGGCTSEGRPYIVMELIEGLPIDRYCESHQLSIAGQIDLFEQLCDAVSYAHNKGIIHRDIKPSNVLVDSNARVHVTDFGLARRLERDSAEQSLTNADQILGTPCFMSPEQASGSDTIGTESDIYSLGAILYCLISGRPPFQGAHPIETLTQVVQDEPIRLHRLMPRVSIDLDTIAMKCLSKLASRRYRTAAELKSDIHRFQTGLPILSRPTSIPERIRRWCVRSPMIASLSLALFVTSITAVCFVVAQWGRAVAAQRVSEQNEATAYRMARAALKLSEHLLQQPNLSGEELPFMKQTLSAYEELAASPNASSTVSFELAQTHHFMGRYFANRGRVDEAQEAYSRQTEILESLARIEPDNERFRFDLFFAYHSMAETFRAEGRVSLEDEFDLKAKRVMVQLFEDFPDNPIYADASAAQCMIECGKAMRTWDFDKADELARRAMTIAKGLMSKNPNRTKSPYYELQAVQAMQMLAHNARIRGDVEIAVESSLAATEICQSLFERIPEDAELEFTAGYNAAVSACVLIECGRYEQARLYVDRADRLILDSMSKLPDAPRRREHYVNVRLRRAWLDWLSGDLKSSREEFEFVILECASLTGVETASTNELLSRLYLECICPFEELRDSSFIDQALLLLEHKEKKDWGHLEWSVVALAKYRKSDLEGSLHALNMSAASAPFFNVDDWVLRALVEMAKGSPEEANDTLDRIKSAKKPTISTRMQSLQAELEHALTVVEQ